MALSAFLGTGPSQTQAGEDTAFCGTHGASSLILVHSLPSETPQQTLSRTPTTLSVIGHTAVHSGFRSHLQPVCPPACPMAHSLPLAPQLVMEDIFISGNPLLESVGLHEPLVEELRAVIANAMSKAMIPLQAYAREYQKYLELNNNDITNFLKCVHTSEGVCVSV